MKYEFHVGDYVETKDRWIGYVDRVDSIDNSLDIVWTSGNAISGETVHADWVLLCDELARIGQYDFTKKDEGKIEFIDGVDTTNPIDSPFIIDKINELIEAVNELQEDYNKHLEAHKQIER